MPDSSRTPTQTGSVFRENIPFSLCVGHNWSVEKKYIGLRLSLFENLIGPSGFSVGTPYM
jgi:hypothetical protein